MASPLVTIVLPAVSVVSRHATSAASGRLIFDGRLDLHATRAQLEDILDATVALLDDIARKATPPTDDLLVVLEDIARLATVHEINLAAPPLPPSEPKDIADAVLGLLDDIARKSDAPVGRDATIAGVAFGSVLEDIARLATVHEINLAAPPLPPTGAVWVPCPVCRGKDGLEDETDAGVPFVRACYGGCLDGQVVRVDTGA